MPARECSGILDVTRLTLNSGLWSLISVIAIVTKAYKKIERFNKTYKQKIIQKVLNWPSQFFACKGKYMTKVLVKESETE